MYNGTQVLVRVVENFERLGVYLLSYIEKRNGTAVLLREIKNSEGSSEFEPSRVTCKYMFSSVVNTDCNTVIKKKTRNEHQGMLICGSWKA